MEEEKNKIIGKQTIIVKDGQFTPEVFWSMGRIEAYSVSPDNTKIAYMVTYFCIDENKGHTVLHIMNSDGSNDTLLTDTANDETSPLWIKNGTKIAFLSNASGKNQIWEMDDN